MKFSASSSPVSWGRFDVVEVPSPRGDARLDAHRVQGFEADRLGHRPPAPPRPPRARRRRRARGSRPRRPRSGRLASRAGTPGDLDRRVPPASFHGGRRQTVAEQAARAPSAHPAPPGPGGGARPRAPISTRSAGRRSQVVGYRSAPPGAAARAESGRPGSSRAKSERMPPLRWVTKP